MLKRKIKMQYDVVIIGGGVAGLTAGLYSARGGKKTLIIENLALGGITATLGKIENYPAFMGTGEELVNNLVGQVMALGVDIQFGEPVAIDFDLKTITLFDGQKYAYKALIIANGVTYRKIGLPTENALKNKGVSYCATCDGRLYKGKDVVVVTNGFVGHNDIEYLRAIANKVYVMDLSESYVNREAEIYHGVKIKEILGSDCVRGVKFERYGKEYIINASAVFVSLGKESDVSLFDGKLDLSNGKIVTDERMQTNVVGVYAVGDIRDKPLRQIVTACSDGAIGGSEAVKYVNSLEK